MPCGQFTFAEDKSIRFYMRHIVSPDEFYVQPLSHTLSTAFSQLRRESKQFYDDDENHKPLFSDIDAEAPETMRGRFGVYRRREQYTEGREIERCVVLDWRESSSPSQTRGIQRIELHVRLIDWGPTQWVKAIHVWILDKRFAQLLIFSPFNSFTF